MEEVYAAAHDDMPISIFLGAGEEEIHDFGIAAWDTVGSMIRVGQILTLRSYPSLKVQTRIFARENHISTSAPLLLWALRKFFTRQQAAAVQGS